MFPLILQCCMESFTISAINFCAASDINLTLELSIKNKQSNFTQRQVLNILQNLAIAHSTQVQFLHKFDPIAKLRWEFRKFLVLKYFCTHCNVQKLTTSNIFLQQIIFVYRPFVAKFFNAKILHVKCLNAKSSQNYKQLSKTNEIKQKQETINNSAKTINKLTETINNSVKTINKLTETINNSAKTINNKTETINNSTETINHKQPSRNNKKIN